MSRLKEDNVRFCYCDESGIGDEPIAVMVGIVVDAQRMHLTKGDWQELLQKLSDKAGRPIAELHASNFYSGNGVWRSMDGPQRAQIITEIFTWLKDRKHRIVYTAINKAMYHDNFVLGKIPDELNTVWRFMGFHLVLAMQKYCQRAEKNKGHTVFVFDNEERERMRFTDLIKNPREWSGEYYGKNPRDKPLNQVIDVPYFGDSKDIGLIQLADVACFFLRRYAEIKEEFCQPDYADEVDRIQGWIDIFCARSIGSSNMFKRQARNDAESLFYDNASVSIRSI